MTLADPEPGEAPRIQRVASGVGIVLPAAEVERLGRFSRLFLRWNERINLGGRISESDLVERHFVDSFAASRFVPHGARVVDVGSGGGLPALPLAIIRPDVRLDLFEPTGKKVAFLRTAVREVDLRDRVSVHAERVVADGTRSLLFDIAMSRATLAPGEWLALGQTLVSAGGSVLVFATGTPASPDDSPDDSFRYSADRCLLVYRHRA